MDKGEAKYNWGQKLGSGFTPAPNIGCWTSPMADI